MRSYHLIPLGLFLLVACTPPPPVNSSRDALWDKFGHHSVDEVLMNWGAPAAESKLTNGSRMLTYRHNTTYDDGSPYMHASGCEVSFLAPPSHYTIENIAMKGDGYECAALAKNGPGITRNAYVAPPPPMFYPGAGFYYR